MGVSKWFVDENRTWYLDGSDQGTRLGHESKTVEDEVNSVVATAGDELGQEADRLSAVGAACGAGTALPDVVVLGRRKLALGSLTLPPRFLEGKRRPLIIVHSRLWAP